jgi:polyphenol oxidase
MLQRQSFPNGVVAYVSPLLREIGVRHAFSTRLGGISPAPFDSMNLGNPNGASVQDDYPRIWMNYRKLQETVRLASDQKPCRVHQVHGKTIARVVAGRNFDTDAKADAIISDDPQRVISVRVADCVPVLLASDDGKIVAAVHAGWRGVVAGIVIQALRQMEIEPASCSAAIGPCIAMDAFEVGPEVVAEFQQVFGSRARCSLPARASAQNALTTPTAAPIAMRRSFSRIGATMASPAAWRR